MPEEDTYKCCFSKMAHSLLHNLRNFLILQTHTACVLAQSQRVNGTGPGPSVRIASI